MSVFKSKTILFALALGILGAVEASLGLFTDFMTPTAYGITTMAVGIIVAILRVVTTVPLSDK